MSSILYTKIKIVIVFCISIKYSKVSYEFRKKNKILNQILNFGKGNPIFQRLFYITGIILIIFVLSVLKELIFIL